MERGVITFIDHFNRAQAFTTTPGMNGWTIEDTSSSGTPTYLCTTADGGAAVLTLASTSEAEIVTLYHNDVLMYDLAQLQKVEFIASVAAFDANTTLVIGVSSGQADDPDATTVNAWFKIVGGASTHSIVCETDDNTNNNDDKATGLTLGSTAKRLTIDFTNGLGDVRFYVDGERVAESTTFDMSDVSAGQNVQPMIQLQKASGTGVGALTLSKVEIVSRYAK